MTGPSSAGGDGEEKRVIETKKPKQEKKRKGQGARERRGNENLTLLAPAPTPVARPRVAPHLRTPFIRTRSACPADAVCLARKNARRRGDWRWFLFFEKEKHRGVDLTLLSARLLAFFSQPLFVTHLTLFLLSPSSPLSSFSSKTNKQTAPAPPSRSRPSTATSPATLTST